MERAFSYFIIPFKTESQVKDYSRIFSGEGWSAVTKSPTCELHEYITDRFFDKENPVCRIWDYRFPQSEIYDNASAPARKIRLPFMRVFAYTEGISFGVLCAEYDDSYTIDEVIETNSSLKFLMTNSPCRFIEKPDKGFGASVINPVNSENILVKKLKAVMGDIALCSTKALLCVYAICPAECMNKETMFYLSTGNSRNFRYSDSMKFSSYTQSENVIQGLSREGIARLVSEDGGDFLTDKDTPFGLIGNYRDNYLWVYIILLCQYYGFKDYNNRALNLYTGNVKKGSWRMRRKMEKLSTQADMFYLQNVHSDVSQITHQNRIYEILFEIYGINALISDFKEDISICNRLLEQEKLNSKMIVIILSTTVAAIAGIMDILANFTSVFEFLFS